MNVEPIAYFKTPEKEKADLPRQGALGQGNVGYICFLPKKGFEQALQDLEGFERIWVLFWMHETKGWKAMVQPPRQVCKKGVFATRSPNRPNPIGLSSVCLLSVRGLVLEVRDHDLLDGTPILDIKPYLPYADSFPGSRTGWIETAKPLLVHQIIWTPQSLLAAEWIQENVGLLFKEKVEKRLSCFESPSSSNRIKQLKSGIYLQACGPWRILFKKEQEIGPISIVAVFSGYTENSLNHGREDPEISLHQKFLQKGIGFLWEKEKDSWQQFLKEG